MASNCARGGLNWIGLLGIILDWIIWDKLDGLLGIISLQKLISSLGRGCLGQQWCPHPGRVLRPCGGGTWGHGSGVALAAALWFCEDAALPSSLPHGGKGTFEVNPAELCRAQPGATCAQAPRVCREGRGELSSHPAVWIT